MMPMPAATGPGPGPDAVFTFFLEEGHPAFQGHFPGNPVLPGVLQVDWAIRWATEAFGPLGTFLGLERVKFLEAIRPLETVDLRLVRTRPGELTFTYLSGAARKGSGTLRFGSAP